jgi:hypothetical protein
MLLVVAAFVANAATQAFAAANASTIRKSVASASIHSGCGVPTSEATETAAAFSREGVNPQRS